MGHRRASAAQIRIENALKRNEYTAIFVVGTVGEAKEYTRMENGQPKAFLRDEVGTPVPLLGWSWRICTMQDLT